MCEVLNKTSQNTSAGRYQMFFLFLSAEPGNKSEYFLVENRYSSLNEHNQPY